MDGESGPRRPGDLVVIALFALLLLGPGLLAIAGHAGVDSAFIESNEQRRPFAAPPPSGGALATGGWQRDLERQIADAFPLRRPLIQTYGGIKFNGLHDSGSRNVMRGRDGWLFLGFEERDYVTGSYHPSDAELARLADVYAARAAWCAKRGIAYVLVLAPNKSTVYADRLPSGITPATPSPADRLIPLMRSRGVLVADPRAALLAAARRGEGRENGEVYSRGDTHWNDAGAYIAYRAVTDALADRGVRDTIVAGTLGPHVDANAGGDLIALSAVRGQVANRWLRYDFPRRAHDVRDPASRQQAGAAFETRASVRDDASLPSAVMFGDSFVEQLHPFLAEAFRRIVTARHGIPGEVQFSRAIVEAERPNVVIEEVAERSLVFGERFKP